jgi:asparagine synthase (glutamine-hydrolysing)
VVVGKPALSPAKMLLLRIDTDPSGVGRDTMSGINGIYFLDGRPVETRDLERMTATISHRGPDDAGIWHHGPVGLGHLMLWTTPESLQEKLPLMSRSGDLVITADARIDNREELMAALRFSGTEAREMADSQLILAAYEKWGEKCPQKLLGDFAFAVWDGREQALFCARDHLGVKPFYYYNSSGVFIFASEIKAILSLPEIPQRLNELMIAEYLQGLFENKDITFYQGIFRLPPGHFLWVRPGQKTLTQVYWELDPLRELRPESDEEYAAGFREIFTEAVRCRLRSAFPVGSELSGGMDSSAVVCVARKLLNTNGLGPLKTFSLVFDHVPETDERFFIQAVVNQGGVESHLLHPERISPLKGIDEMFHAGDGPVGLIMRYLFTEALYPAARQRGVRVLLDGAEGDNAVSHGYEYLPELLQRGHWGKLYREVNLLGRRRNLAPLRAFWFWALKPAIPEPVLRQFWKILGKRWWDSDQEIINPDFARRMGLKERQQALVRQAPPAVTPSRKQHWLLLTAGMDSYCFEALDKTAAPFGIEQRHPFYDKRLLEFCLALPPEQKLHQGWNRLIMRRALAHLYPPEVCWRGSKTSFRANFVKALLAYERPRLEELVIEDPEAIRPYINLAVLRRDYQQLLAGKKGDYCFSIWRAVTLALWLRQMNPESGRQNKPF